ncbi:ferrochelatase [Yersinia pestis 1045]|nr:ferrochelatase [Yersinia pseudotuberculosis]AJI93043.1 ferrochelatase [Yersinia pestis]AJJ00473.1 ferrochelatase [Yersinia pestis Pestoides F]AJJ56889.1 ferrochelatase [Yersinia pseudotuberculosis IP 32953]AJJ60697.1 ferrochelatase [Yersinia pseudotuberculosis YPIII]AJJ68278.1 ferrochelatase [Yersinia pseudotuberculosis PB1/+]AJJ74519.1 ferrochelatase [Yersinia pestis A1122]AJJ80809.1 ferrochelatase [Yersinia pestis Antiqua]AJJ85473.1 ferrochelatase [Yersinia pestis Angola]AJJ88110.1 fe
MQSKPGVLMVNLGTPDAPTSKAIKRYLAEFLSDRRVVDTSPLLWWPLLHGVILPLRSPRVAKLYQSVWMEEGSPLLVYSRRQQKALAARMPDIPVELGMSYGSPNLPEAIEKLLAQGVTNLVILPLYPQYSCSTSAAVWDAVARVLKGYRRLPSISFIRDYAEHPAYISALKQSVERSFAEHGQPDRLVMSFHGIPKRYAQLGDDYPIRCEDTSRALRAALPLPAEKIIMTYQSRFGREPWLTPYTDETLKSLPSQGVKHIQLICPGFSADCLETLEEIKEQNREFFLHAGGEKFEYIPALNDDEGHIALLEQLIRHNI